MNLSRTYPADASWSASWPGRPRTVADVLAYLVSYRVRVQGNGVDRLGDYSAEQAAIDLAPGTYTVQVLALGPGVGPAAQPLLLGAGQAAGVTVAPGQITAVTVPMSTFCCSFDGTPATVEVDEDLPVLFTLCGPLLEDLLGAAGTAELRYIADYPAADAFGTGSTAFLEYAGSRATGQVALAGRTAPGQVYFQLFQAARPGWSHHGKTPVFAFPSVLIEPPGAVTVLAGETPGS